MTKKLLSLFALQLLAAMAMPVRAQVVSNDNEDGVNKVDQRYAKSFVPGQVLVKMKDGSPASVRRNARGKFQSAGLSQLDAVLKEFGVENMEQLLPHEKPGRPLRKAKAFNGTIVQERDLSQLYLLRMNEEKAMETYQLIERLAELPEVEYAEPNYIAYIMADADDYVAEPLYSQQWGLSAINMPALWDAEKISQKRPVIAILDTGVDINHPDLVANIWTNTVEADGEEGYDNDGNGFKNDLHGWDFVNQTGNVRDFNGHGTHCAGIAAAVGKNGTGVVGANPDALIMPITVMQSDGTGDLATLIRGIDYAVAMGADVLSMSIGTYATSNALQQALGRAYQNAILVAAAGNDGYCLNHIHLEKGQQAPMPMFPAAYSFILGVQASAVSGDMTGFSNYDDDGAFFSEYSEDKLYNYELRAPGASILSTWPNGNYKQLNGTSMACPLVAGALSRLMQCKEIDSKEELFGDLLHSTMPSGDLDIYAAYQMSDANRQPTLYFVTYTIDDSEGDGDGRPDAGETIAIYPIIRNGWGIATNIQLSIEVGEFEDPDIVEILNNNVAFGSSLNSYAKNVTANPLRLKISENCVDGRHIKLVIKANCDNISEQLQQDIKLVAENGVELKGVIAEDMTLTPDKNYIITGNLAIPDGVTLTIEPGTVLKFKDGVGFNVSDNGTLNAIGEPGKMIEFTKADLDLGDVKPLSLGVNTIKYVKIHNFHQSDGSSYFFDSKNSKNGPILDNCIIGNIYNAYSFSRKKNTFNNSNFTNITTRYGYEVHFNNCNLCNDRSHWDSNNIRSSSFFTNENVSSCNLYNIIAGKNQSCCLLMPAENGDIANVTFAEPNYYGTGLISKAQSLVADINNPMNIYNGYAQLDLSNMLTQPNPEAHGIVWKVVVNGYDAQDEYEQLPPLGVGKHKFEVYFNRPMNKEVAPQIAFGVRDPYTQNAVAEDGSWNEEGTIYTAYKTITGKTKSDGLNRIYVYGAEDDEFFEIPYENTRFNILINVAGSMATGFAAEAGMGRVDLTWDNSHNDFDDAMGFNIYRYQLDGGGNEVNSRRINQDIVDIETTEYSDYDVVPGQTYYYMYKVLSTDLKEYDVSNVVAATPLTATLGDANGSGDVDVADVITTVNQITGMEPKPFIFEAADVNVDKMIDVLDVIGIIQKILNPGANTLAMSEFEATYTIEDGTLYVESPVALAGVQVQLSSTSCLNDNGEMINDKYTVADDLKGFEHTSAWLSDNDYLFLAYNMNGKTLSPGKHALLHIGDAMITQIRLSDANGHNILVNGDDATKVNRMASDVMTIPGIYDMQGRKLSGNTNDVKLPKGVYIINGQKVVR